MPDDGESIVLPGRDPHPTQRFPTQPELAREHARESPNRPPVDKHAADGGKIEGGLSPGRFPQPKEFGPPNPELARVPANPSKSPFPGTTGQTLRPLQSPRSYLALGMLAVGVIMLLGGVLYGASFWLGRDDKSSKPKKMQASNDLGMTFDKSVQDQPSSFSKEVAKAETPDPLKSKEKSKAKPKSAKPPDKQEAMPVSVKLPDATSTPNPEQTPAVSVTVPPSPSPTPEPKTTIVTTAETTAPPLPSVSTTKPEVVIVTSPTPSAQGTATSEDLDKKYQKELTALDGRLTKVETKTNKNAEGINEVRRQFKQLVTDNMSLIRAWEDGAKARIEKKPASDLSPADREKLIPVGGEVSLKGAMERTQRVEAKAADHAQDLKHLREGGETMDRQNHTLGEFWGGAPPPPPGTLPPKNK